MSEAEDRVVPQMISRVLAANPATFSLTQTKHIQDLEDIRISLNEGLHHIKLAPYERCSFAL